MTIDRLRAHWGFTRMPFAKDLAPSMLYSHRSHAEAVARVAWCIDEQALGVLTGEVGAGKTVAVRAALAGIDASRHTVIYLGNPSVGVRGLYSTIVSALGGVPRFHRASLIPQAQDALATEEHERGRKVVLILDEAHMLDADQLEGLRLLTNSQMDNHAPFACVLLGSRRKHLVSGAVLCAGRRSHRGRGPAAPLRPARRRCRWRVFALAGAIDLGHELTVHSPGRVEGLVRLPEIPFELHGVLS
jgi:hypothetical protein